MLVHACKGRETISTIKLNTQADVCKYDVFVQAKWQFCD